jgi:phosphomannomutase
MTSLRQRMLEDMQIRNLAPATQRAYVEHVSRYARHFGRSPAVLGPEEIRVYCERGEGLRTGLLRTPDRPNISYRPSGTENLLRVYSETSRPETTRRVLEAVKQMVHNLQVSA